MENEKITTNHDIKSGLYNLYIDMTYHGNNTWAFLISSYSKQSVRSNARIVGSTFYDESTIFFELQPTRIQIVFHIKRLNVMWIYHANACF